MEAEQQQEQQQLIWQYLNEVTDKLTLLEKEVKAHTNIMIKMSPSEYIEHIQEVTHLSPQELEFLKKKHGVM